MGKLIVIEGLDGSGKATQTAMLHVRLQRDGINCSKLSFPNYDEETSALVKMYLHGELGSLDEVGAFGASLFYTVDRYGSYLRHWKRDYDSGSVILCDRYATSNIAHQMSKLPREQWDDYLDWLEELEYKRVGLPAPTRVVYLDMHPETSKKLLAARYAGDESKRDLHEANYEYLLNCRKAALYGAQRKGWTVLRCCDSSQPYPVNEIAAQVYDAVREVL